MRLSYSKTSPYARKVLITLAEFGLIDQVEMIAVNPLAEGGAESLANPLGKIPILQLSDGTALFDSRVICSYLTQLHGGAPDSPDCDHWAVQRAQALGDGVLDAAFNIVMERRRDDANQSEHWLARWENAILRSLPEIEKDIAARPEPFDIGQVTYACVFGYLDFRLPHIAWRERYPTMSDWWQMICQRESVANSVPV